MGPNRCFDVKLFMDSAPPSLQYRVIYCLKRKIRCFLDCLERNSIACQDYLIAAYFIIDIDQHAAAVVIGGSIYTSTVGAN
ncbi:hypothetical protein NSK_003288 [Nannochloropsis salina CCMP1776]|uniref:Uncharacterized protein n=1 Tax=Nannochloropsis salina CCMP1776 TaxID=1027361 RepID=A0A4D9D433_9STRA|nr:hypothetical protein NSK_003288 [Nannochloropsis salina CCMP1776]|eukprot:TFJ85784.1 hypothetical protein NSK_003288 [Nannochloropsis salina CCMP1776]